MTTRVVSDKVIPLVLEGRVQLLCWSYSDLENKWRGETVVSMMREDRIRAWRNIIRYCTHHLSTRVTTLTFGSESAMGPYKLTMAKKIVPLILNLPLKSSS